MVRPVLLRQYRPHSSREDNSGIINQDIQWPEGLHRLLDHAAVHPHPGKHHLAISNALPPGPLQQPECFQAMRRREELVASLPLLAKAEGRRPPDALTRTRRLRPPFHEKRASYPPPKYSPQRHAENAEKNQIQTSSSKSLKQDAIVQNSGTLKSLRLMEVEVEGFPCHFQNGRTVLKLPHYRRRFTLGWDFDTPVTLGVHLPLRPLRALRWQLFSQSLGGVEGLRTRGAEKTPLNPSSSPRSRSSSNSSGGM